MRRIGDQNYLRVLTMSHQRVSTNLPLELFAAVEQACEREHRSRSELLREALLRYLRPPKITDSMLDEVEDRLELQDPRAQDDIEASRQDVEAGRVRPVDKLLAELEPEPARAPAARISTASRD